MHHSDRGKCDTVKWWWCRCSIYLNRTNELLLTDCWCSHSRTLTSPSMHSAIVEHSEIILRRKHPNILMKDVIMLRNTAHTHVGTLWRSDKDVKAVVAQWFQQQSRELFAEGSISRHINGMPTQHLYGLSLMASTPSPRTISEQVSFQQASQILPRGICLEGLRKTMTPTPTIVSVWAEIWTCNLQNIKQELCPPPNKMSYKEFTNACELTLVWVIYDSSMLGCGV
jgi:hypothetical protein